MAKKLDVHLNSDERAAIVTGLQLLTNWACEELEDDSLTLPERVEMQRALHAAESALQKLGLSAGNSQIVG